MLMIQNICLIWHKNERGAAFAEARARFPYAYELMDFPTDFSRNAIANNLLFYQSGLEIIDSLCYNRLIWGTPSKKLLETLTTEQVHKIMIENEIRIKKHKYENYPDFASIRLKNISFDFTGGVCKVNFSYDSRRNGMPLRRGRNKDFNDESSAFYHQDLLNETAFLLENGRYGRIVYNERLSDVDTGEWYYKLWIINIVNDDSEKPATDIFTSREVDYCYDKTADLF